MQDQTDYIIEKSKIANSFAMAAVSYDAYASLQREVADHLLKSIDQHARPFRILDIGSGTGYCTLKLRSIFPRAEIISLDIAEGMLSFAKENNSGSYICADTESLPLLDDSIDLIVSSLAIQWCEDYSRLFSELHRVLSEKGLAYLSTFGPKTLQELKQAWKKVDDFVHVNQFVAENCISKIIADESFTSVSIESKIMLRSYKSLSALTRELKAIGAHNMNRGQAKGLGGRQKITQVKNIFEAGYISEKGIPVSYELQYISLVK